MPISKSEVQEEGLQLVAIVLYSVYAWLRDKFKSLGGLEPSEALRLFCFWFWRASKDFQNAML